MSNIEIGYLVALIIAIVEAFKQAGLNSRYAPLLSVVLGLGGAWFFFGTVNYLATVAGILFGLAATGGYRLVKTSILGK